MRFAWTDLAIKTWQAVTPSEGVDAVITFVYLEYKACTVVIKMGTCILPAKQSNHFMYSALLEVKSLDFEH